MNDTSGRFTHERFKELKVLNAIINKDIFDLMDLSIVVINNAGIIVFANKTWKKNISPRFNGNAHFLSENNYIKSIDRFIEDDVQVRKYKDLISKAIDEKTKAPELIIQIDTNSGQRWVNIQLLPLAENTGYTLILHQDITNIKNAHPQKTESELVFRMLIENMQDIVFTLGRDLKYTGVYGKWVEKAGKKESDFIGLTAMEIIGAENGKIHEDSALEAFKGKTVTYQWETINPAGKKLHFQISLAPIMDSNRVISGLVGFGREITDLTEERNKAQISDKLKSNFLASISHEIRTPLNAILGFSQLMLEHPNLDENLRDYANIIIRRGNDLVNIVDDIMEISMIQSGAVQPEFDEVPVNVLLNSIYEDYSTQLSLKSSNIEFKHEKRIYGKKFFIHSDGNILRQIINRIIDNSIKFTSQGQIKFGYRLKEEDEIVFYVSDTGMGILPEKQKLIFDLFRTGDETNTRSHDGLGLGLAIVKELVSLLAGDIWFSSLPGKGTDMFFSIPFEKFGTSELKPFNEEKDRNLFPGKKILVVEDDSLNGYYIKQVLEAAQIEILYAADGKKAMKTLDSTQDIDLVFLDLNLPFHSGEEILKRLRKSGNHVKVIIQSAFRTDAYNIPSSDYTSFLSKPFKPAEVYNVLQKYL